MSAIQIFVGDKMACVSHLVGEDTIGWEKELQLDNEVRMIISNALLGNKHKHVQCELFTNIIAKSNIFQSLSIHHGGQC